MERKKIENMRECCKNTFYCRECPHKELCDEIIKKVPLYGELPARWSDEDIDDVLDEINKEE
ncbi:hypothetical protein [Clostridium sp. Ade.TY]|uniref:hypothetical protein n=1 Tax=Clostridium sp. Ade.TY TaxID=1391647 RepID=UPI0003FF634C|nr:hypothetical protein [Clostridium sp. Ade.TY]